MGPIEVAMKLAEWVEAGYLRRSVSVDQHDGTRKHYPDLASAPPDTKACDLAVHFDLCIARALEARKEG